MEPSTQRAYSRKFWRESSFHLVRSEVNADHLMAAINKRPDLWDQITKRQTINGSPHTDTRSIFLRWAENQTLEAVFNDLDAIDYPAFEDLPEFRPIITDILRAVSATHLGRAIIVDLKPGGFITPHVDEGSYADHYERFHLVLKSEPGNSFHVQTSHQFSEAMQMRTGELWWFNHKKEHCVYNNSKHSRIHLIVDCVAPRYRQERA